MKNVKKLRRTQILKSLQFFNIPNKKTLCQWCSILIKQLHDVSYKNGQDYVVATRWNSEHSKMTRISAIVCVVLPITVPIICPLPEYSLHRRRLLTCRVGHVCNCCCGRRLLLRLVWCFYKKKLLKKLKKEKLFWKIIIICKKFEKLKTFWNKIKWKLAMLKGDSELLARIESIRTLNHREG